jgi:DUF4097 and DUF4098 domain-containing protein YvlB
MVKLLVRLGCVAIVASLPVPLSAQYREARSAARWTAKSWRASFEARMGPEQEERIAKSFRVGPNGALDLSNVSGDITIREGTGDTITVDAVKRVRGRDSDVRDQLARTTVTMVEHAGRVEVRTSYDGRNLRTSVDYLVTTPAGTSVIARSVSGDVKITGIKGDVRVESVSGNVTAINTPSVSLVKSVSGDLVINGVSMKGDLRATTVSGDVTLRSATVRLLDASSVSGDIALSDVTCDRATAGTTSGTVDFTGSVGRGGRLEFKSHSGDVRVALTGTPGFEVDARTFSGSIRSDLPVTTKPGEPISPRRLSKAVHGVVGDGSAQLVLSTFSGDVTIVKK